LELQTARGIGGIPRSWDQGGGHDARNVSQGTFGISSEEVRIYIYSLPGGGAYCTPTLVLCFDRAELKVDVLREISHEREDFVHAIVSYTTPELVRTFRIVHRDGLDTLFQEFSIFDKLRLGRNRSI
jgi:hypothetical protein